MLFKITKSDAGPDWQFHSKSMKVTYHRPPTEEEIAAMGKRKTIFADYNEALQFQSVREDGLADWDAIE